MDNKLFCPLHVITNIFLTLILTLTLFQDEYYLTMDPLEEDPAKKETCVRCDCLKEGSTSTICDKKTGQCQCKPNVVGLKCDKCPGVWQEISNGCSGKIILPFCTIFTIFLKPPSKSCNPFFPNIYTIIRYFFSYYVL